MKLSASKALKLAELRKKIDDLIFYPAHAIFQLIKSPDHYEMFVEDYVQNYPQRVEMMVNLIKKYKELKES